MHLQLWGSGDPQLQVHKSGRLFTSALRSPTIRYSKGPRAAKQGDLDNGDLDLVESQAVITHKTAEKTVILRQPGAACVEQCQLLRDSGADHR